METLTVPIVDNLIQLVQNSNAFHTLEEIRIVPGLNTDVDNLKTVIGLFQQQLTNLRRFKIDSTEP